MFVDEGGYGMDVSDISLCYQHLMMNLHVPMFQISHHTDLSNCLLQPSQEGVYGGNHKSLPIIYYNKNSTSHI